MKLLTPSILLKSLTPQPGDIIQMQAGNYPGLDLTGLGGVKFVAIGLVNFTGNIKVGGTSGVTLDGTGIEPYGFKYSGKDFQIFDPGKGNVNSLTVMGFDFGNTASVAFDAQTKIWVSAGNMLTYNGIRETCVFFSLYVEQCKISGKTAMFFGPFDPVTTYRMVSRYLNFKKVVCVNDGTGYTPKISGQSIYDLVIEDWTVTGPTLSTEDCGIIFITGNANIIRLRRDGGLGYIGRIINVFLDSPGSSSIQNCIDINSTHYGTVDTRLNPEFLNAKAPIPLYGGDFYFLHNTCGDKKDDGSYVTNAVVAGEMKDESGNQFRIIVKDNIAFNAMPSGAANNSSLIKNNGSTVIEMSNNIDLPPGVPLPSGYFVDKIDFVPAPGSPLIGKASDGADIGAVRYIPLTKQRTAVKVETKIFFDDGTTQTL